MAGDLDRRRAHDLRLDSLPLQRGERGRRDAGVALHSRPDEADLPEVLPRVPAHGQPVERGGGVPAILDRGGEDDLGARLDDRVDVDVRLREGREEQGRRHAGDAVDGLLPLVHDA